MDISIGFVPITPEDKANFGQVLSRLKRMKQRWRPVQENPHGFPMFERIRTQLASARTGTARGHFHWFGMHYKEKAEDDTTLQLGYREVWKTNEGRNNLKRLEFRHKSNLPHDFDKFDRTALESWMKSLDPMSGMDPVIRGIPTAKEPELAPDLAADLAIEGKSTAEIRRIADFRSYQSTFMAPAAVPDQQADADIRAQLERAEADTARSNVVDFRVDRSVDLEPDSSEVTVQAVAGTEAKYVLMAPDDSIAEEAAAVANSIGQAVHK